MRPAGLIDTTALTALLIDVGRARHQLLKTGGTPQNAWIDADLVDCLEETARAVYAKELEHVLGLQILANPSPGSPVSVA